MRHQRPSAALVLGVLAGVLASVTYLPTIVPVTLRIVDAEQLIALRQASSASAGLSRLLDAGTVPTPSILPEMDLAAISVSTADGVPVYQIGMPLPEAAVVSVCQSGTAQLVELEGKTWAIGCLENPRNRVVVAHEPTYSSGANAGYLVLLLSLIVGIITALGVLRLLNPLSQVSRALARVGAGERGVRLQPTGLKELDEITDRLNAAARAMEDREDAVKARIQVVQEMARMFAHEVRNPLQSLELLTTLIATEEDATERLDLANSIHTEIRALDNVVSRMLREGASKGSLRIQKTLAALPPLAEQVYSLRRPEASNRGIRLTLGLMTWREVPIDATLVGRMIENLVLNATQAIQAPGGEVRISIYEEGPWVCLAVDDNGPGVAPQVLEHIFEPNVTTKAGGSGLGLALVKGVVEAHGGYITCEPSALGGARFVARLPIEGRNEGTGVDWNEAANPGGG